MMKLIKEYTDYLKDNPNGYWFKRKLYGWGWTPATWQGWIVILGFVAFLVFQEALFEFTPQGQSDTLLLVANILLAVIAILLICKIKGEKPKWQWGKPK